MKFWPILLLVLKQSDGFVVLKSSDRGAVSRRISSSRGVHCQQATLHAASSSSSLNNNEARRKELLMRRGPYFKLDGNKIEFGATANLVTTLCENNEPPDLSSIVSWLQDERSMALSIWDEQLTQELGNHIYRLQVMTLQFVTLQVAPTVDMHMKTQYTPQGMPVFALHSVAFDPNVQLLPGMKMNAESLGIVIEVAGQLRPTQDGTGVVGAIAFQTTGKLPLPLRLVPQTVLKKASDTINETVVNFAIKSFQKGTRANYKAFQQKRHQQGHNVI